MIFWLTLCVGVATLWFVILHVGNVLVYAKARRLYHDIWDWRSVLYNGQILLYPEYFSTYNKLKSLLYDHRKLLSKHNITSNLVDLALWSCHKNFLYGCQIWVKKNPCDSWTVAQAISTWKKNCLDWEEFYSDILMSEWIKEGETRVLCQMAEDLEKLIDAHQCRRPTEKIARSPQIDESLARLKKLVLQCCPDEGATQSPGPSLADAERSRYTDPETRYKEKDQTPGESDNFGIQTDHYIIQDPDSLNLGKPSPPE